MTDIENVINGLEHCKNGDCDGCPYDQIREESLHGKHYKWGLVCNEQLTEDILAMLKEQEDEKKRIMKVIWDTLHDGLSIDTVADQDWAYERIRHRIEDT